MVSSVSPVPRGPRILFTVVATLWVVMVVRLCFPDALPHWLRFLYSGVTFGSAALCAWRAIAVPRERAAWAVMAAGIACFACGGLHYGLVIAPDTDAVHFPTIGDALYLGWYPLAYIALGLLARARLPRVSPVAWLDGIVAGLATGAVAVAIAAPALHHAVGDPLQVLATLAYPVGDLVLLGMVAVVFGALRPGGRGTRMLLLAMTLFVCADLLYLLRTADGGYVPNTPLDALWPAALLTVAVAAWQPARPIAARTAASRGALLLPIGAAVAVLGVLFVDHYTRLATGGVWLAIAAAGGLLIRSALLAHAHRRMLDTSERDARTDALTGLANRRALIETLDWIDMGEWPVVLALYDLDGFKTYNDRYGHPAGDALLQRLASRLTAAAPAPAQVFRIGGDEFCVIVEPGAAEAVLRATDEALCEHGEGFQIVGSRGEVRLPDEAADATAALALVDQRMYAAKRGGRVSVVAQTRDVLLRAVEERNPALGGHVGDVAGLAVLVGEFLGLDAEQLGQVRAAAELHDVGKLAVPDAILDKPGPLTPDEWTFMHRHTIVGERILHAAPALADVAPLVRASHERWDGAGYPDGLAGTQIPLGARIVTLCDAWDAMVSDRPYRAALSPDDALEELQRCSGTQFDPTVVRAFEQVLALDADALLAA
jgi:two-component system, cell cycle response regulator